MILIKLFHKNCSSFTPVSKTIMITNFILDEIKRSIKYTLIKDVYLIYVLAFILSPQFTKSTEYKTSNQKRKSQIIIETNLLDM
jgi:hypothetical protein